MRRPTLALTSPTSAHTNAQRGTTPQAFHAILFCSVQSALSRRKLRCRYSHTTRKPFQHESARSVAQPRFSRWPLPCCAWMGEAGSIPVREEKIAGSSYHEQTTVRVNRLGCPQMRLRLRPAERGVYRTCHFGVCRLTPKSRSIRCWPCAVPKFFEPPPAAKSPGTKLSNGRRQGDKWQARYTLHTPVAACEGIPDNN